MISRRLPRIAPESWMVEPTPASASPASPRIVTDFAGALIVTPVASVTSSPALSVMPPFTLPLAVMSALTVMF